MKKVFAILLALVMVTSLFAVATDVGSDDLKLTYLKSSATKYGVAWFSNGTFTTALETAPFNASDGATKNVEAYLRSVSNFSSVECTISAVFKPLLPASAVSEGKSTSIGYTATIDNLTNDTISDAETSIASSSADTSIVLGKMPANELVTQTGALKFTFVANSDDIAKAQENVAYNTTITVTMASN